MNKLHYEFVKLEIDNWDPMGLFAGGAPDAEYEPEIINIVNELHTVNNEIELSSLIKNVLKKWFDEEFSYESCLKVAENIWSKIQS